ncbi:MAG: class I adenylate-forming enzyme family protein [Burkholderiaceae bacterium]
MSQGANEAVPGDSPAYPMPRAWPTVVHLLADAARRSPSAEALVAGDDTLDYASYVACVSGLAAHLQGLGIGRGDRVAVLLRNGLDIAIATFGVQAAGAQLVPLNPGYTAAELGPILANAECRAMLYDDSAAASLQTFAAAMPAGYAIRVGGNGLRLTSWRDEHDRVATLPLPHTDDLSTLQYTGGTTGVSKGVELTHRAVAVNVSQREALLPTDRGPSACWRSRRCSMCMRSRWACTWPPIARARW